MKYCMISFRSGVIFILFLCCCVACVSSYSGDLKVSGPDGEISINAELIDELKSEHGVKVMVDGGDQIAVPLWRVVRLADSNKELGPGDIIEISADSTIQVPFQTAYKNVEYLMADIGNDLFFVLDTDGSTVSKGRVQSIDISTTEDWELVLSSGDEKKSITKDSWDELISQNYAEKTDKEGRVFSGVPIFWIFESQGIVPGEASRLKITGQDRYSVEIPWIEIAANQDYLLADQMNHESMPKFIVLSEETGNTPAWPLMVIDPQFPSINSVGNVAELSILP